MDMKDKILKKVNLMTKFTYKNSIHFQNLSIDVSKFCFAWNTNDNYLQLFACTVRMSKDLYIKNNIQF